MARFIDELKRTHSCGALRGEHDGHEVVLFGWVANRRDHGNLIFVDLRDRDGVTQIVFDPEASPEAHSAAEALRSEWVIGIRGKVKSRGEQFSKKEGKMVSANNPDLPTGEIELEVLEIEVFNKSPSKSATARTHAKRSVFSIDTSISVAHHFRRRSAPDIRFVRLRATISPHRVPPKSRRHFWSSIPPAGRATFSCRAASMRASSMRWPKARSSSNSY